MKYPIQVKAATVFVFLFAVSLTSNAAVLIIDLSDFRDTDPDTNNITITSVTGEVSSSDITATETGNFPIVGIEGLFVTDKTTSNFIPSELTEIVSGLQDYLGNPYGNLHVNEHFCDLSDPVSPIEYCMNQGNKSLGMLNTTRNTHRFSTTDTAFTGSSTWDLTGYGLTLSDFNLSGEVTAQAYSPGITFKPIGKWEAYVPNTAPAFTTTPTISGDATVGSILSVNDGSPNDADGDTITASYQWVSNNVDIASATSMIYEVQEIDLGNNIHCNVTASDNYSSTTVSTAAVTISSGLSNGGSSGATSWLTLISVLLFLSGRYIFSRKPIIKS